jgi:hypothetical protein
VPYVWTWKISHREGEGGANNGLAGLGDQRRPMEREKRGWKKRRIYIRRDKREKEKHTTEE